jgi:hypothetical protein
MVNEGGYLPLLATARKGRQCQIHSIYLLTCHPYTARGTVAPTSSLPSLQSRKLLLHPLDHVVLVNQLLSRNHGSNEGTVGLAVLDLSLHVHNCSKVDLRRRRGGGGHWLWLRLQSWNPRPQESRHGRRRIARGRDRRDRGRSGDDDDGSGGRSGLQQQRPVRPQLAPF